jgi:predicted ATPase
LHLGPINVVIGSNGSGKSNFISVFSFLHSIREGRLQEYVTKAGGANQVLHFGSKVTQQIRIKLAFWGESNLYEIILIPTADDKLAPLKETAFFWDKRYASPYDEPLTASAGEAGISRTSSRNVVTYVQKHLDRWRLYHFHDTSVSAPLRQSAKIEDNSFLRGDGSNLPAFLYMLKKTYPTNYEMIVKTVKRVAPFFRDFNLTTHAVRPEFIRLNWTHSREDAFFGPESLSDGSIRFIALATLFLQPPHLRPSLILLDEPELGLHPYALSVLASLIKSASVYTQVIVSTQSALLLDNFDPEDVIVADQVDQATVLQRLDAEKYSNWLDTYSLGQLWEKAEFGGRPGSGNEARQ